MSATRSEVNLNLVSYVFLKSVNTDSLRWRVLERAHADVRRVVYNANRSAKSGLVSAVLGGTLKQGDRSHTIATK